MDTPILQRPIEWVATSDEFLEMCKANGFSTLGNIIEYTASELLEKPLFNYRMLLELLDLLAAFNLSKKLKS
jgi:DNA-directed RNA polymerase alpha subunit